MGFKARGKERAVGKRIRAVSEGGAERQDKRRLRGLKSPGTRRQALKARERGEEGGLRKRRRHGEEAGLTKTRRASGRKPRSVSTLRAQPPKKPMQGRCSAFYWHSKQISGPPLCPNLGSRRGGRQSAQCNHVIDPLDRQSSVLK